MGQPQRPEGWGPLPRQGYPSHLGAEQQDWPRRMTLVASHFLCHLHLLSLFRHVSLLICSVSHDTISPPILAALHHLASRLKRCISSDTRTHAHSQHLHPVPQLWCSTNGETLDFPRQGCLTFHLAIFKKTKKETKKNINPCNGWSNKIILGLIDVSFVPLWKTR